MNKKDRGMKNNNSIIRRVQFFCTSAWFSSLKWKVIPGYTRYEISTHGSVRHIKHKRILKQIPNFEDCLQVNIHNDSLNRQVSKSIQSLMALTFLGPKPEGFKIEYKDKDRKNNHISNLHYVCSGS